MREWLLSLGFRWGYSWAVSYTGGWLRKDAARLAALKKYRAHGTLVEICRVYAELTPEITDDQIVESIEQLKRDLTVVPFKQLVTQNQILVIVGQTKIPDFDGDPTNDQAVADLLARIMEESLTKE